MTKYEIESLNVMRCCGKSTTGIALALGLSVNTVRFYIRRHPPEDTVQIRSRRSEKYGWLQILLLLRCRAGCRWNPCSVRLFLPVTTKTTEK